MFSFQKQFSAATRTNLGSPFVVFTTLAEKTVEALEKLVILNFHTVKATNEEAAMTAKKIFSVTTPQQFFSAATEGFQSNIDTIQAYARHLADVSASTQAEFIKAAQLPKIAPIIAPMKTIPVTAPVTKTETLPVQAELAISEPVPPANDEIHAKTAPETAAAEPEAVQQNSAKAVAEPAIPTEAAAKPRVEAPAEKPAVKKPAAAKPRAKAAAAKTAGTASFPKPGVNTLVKKPAPAKPAAPKITAAARNVSKTAAKKKG